MKQVDLFELDVIVCKKCSRCFSTMSQSSKHHAIKHIKNTIIKTLINFTLKIFCLISTKIFIEEKLHLSKIRGGD